MRRLSMTMLALAVLAGLPACSTKEPEIPRVRMSAKEIVDQSSPAVVRIEAGDSKVGTGFIVDPRGVIATNLHVIEGESEIKIRTHDGAQYPVTAIMAMDKDHDLALVRIYPKRLLPKVRLGDSNLVSAGDKIYAIGNPLGVFDYSVSDGLISQVRPLSAGLTILQISAPISPGSSGGPLFNQYGEVIGVTTAIITQGQSINLAVPTNYLRPMIAQQTAMSPVEFAKQTKDDEPPDERAAEGDEEHVQIVRKVPVHPLTVWDGCTQDDVEEIVTAISDAIDNGAPLYNTGTKQGYEACYRIYEGTALKFKDSAHCKGVRAAFGEGLLRAGTLGTYKEKAWAMRDAFDGLIDVAKRWAQAHPQP